MDKFSIPMRIKGIGVLGGFGVGLACLEETLLGSRDPEVEMTTHELNDGPVFIPVMRADVSALENYVPKRNLRRIDHYSRMAVLGACLALEDAGSPVVFPDRTGVIIVSGYGAMATTFSFLDSVINDGDNCASPTHFSNSVHNAAAAHISILLKITGPCLSVSQFETSVASGLLTARQWLAQGRAHEVLFGAVDEYCPVRGYSSLRLLGRGKQDKPNGNKLLQPGVMGEGAAFMLLAKADDKHGGYADIVDVRQEIQGRASLDLPREDLLILGTGQDMACDFPGIDVIKNCSQAIDCSHIYGTLPVGQAFDLAIAALMIRKKKVFPNTAFCSDTESVNKSSSMSYFSGITCLKLNKGGEYGQVRIARL